MKRQFIIGLFLHLCLATYAQEDSHSFFLNTGGGLQKLSYELENGNVQNGLGYTVNAGYNYFFNEHWGFQTGVGIQSFSPEATLNYQTVTPSIDADNEDYEYRTTYVNWKEKQKLLFFDIPLGLLYRQVYNEKIQVQATAGVKISVPLKASYQTSGGEIVTSGYYSQWNVELIDLPQHGFSTITNQFTGDVSFKPSYSGFAELGALYKLTYKLDLYVGGYVNYGLNNVAKSNDQFVYQQDGAYNGVFESTQIDRARIVSLGVKIGVQWNLRNKKAVEEPFGQVNTGAASKPLSRKWLLLKRKHQNQKQKKNQ